MEKSDFENLEVWQKGMTLAEFCLDLTNRLSNQKKHYRLIEQLESSSMGIPQNIAEGKGRFSKK
ncbi:MAG: four helix bundle protein [Bacteroidales bacterium]|nr:four helix bundle protein [Bacteroidales bacterium]MCF8345549.1 four helix bundle protein [Bacteroidales bacterium]MCF8351046.1 four helix bundle protein [Bacteroidales bacterium]MCF8375888.1 four helix bundle protein [Bacteroidales bacterium]MCF8402010.1 four helix bundle protein [Bacteroidales bacterium]